MTDVDNVTEAPGTLSATSGFPSASAHDAGPKQRTK